MFLSEHAFFLVFSFFLAVEDAAGLCIDGEAVNRRGCLLAEICQCLLIPLFDTGEEVIDLFRFLCRLVEYRRRQADFKHFD